MEADKTKIKPATTTTKTKTTTGKTKEIATNVTSPLKKDGTPDKRFSSNKNLKKDGTPDMRYKTNKKQ